MELVPVSFFSTIQCFDGMGAEGDLVVSVATMADGANGKILAAIAPPPFCASRCLNFFYTIKFPPFPHLIHKCNS